MTREVTPFQECQRIIRELRVEIKQLRAALQECAADYVSPPCSVAQGAQYTTAEFQRRMRVAAAALEPKP